MKFHLRRAALIILNGFDGRPVAHHQVEFAAAAGRVAREQLQPAGLQHRQCRGFCRVPARPPRVGHVSARARRPGARHRR